MVRSDAFRPSRRSSSVGESTRLISAGSTVRIRPPAPIALVVAKAGVGWLGKAGRVSPLRPPTRTYPPEARTQRLAAGRAGQLLLLSASASSSAEHALLLSRYARRRRRLGRIGFSCARAPSARARRGRRPAARGAGALQPSAARCGGRRRALRARGGGLARRAAVQRPRRRRRAGAPRASLARRRRRARRATRGSSRRGPKAAPRLSRSATPATIRPKPSCCGCLPGAGPRGLAADASEKRRRSSGRCSGAAAKDLRDWLAARAPLPFVEDESNADVAIPRNRVRAELVPLLEQRFNPGRCRRARRRGGDLARAWSWVDSHGHRARGTSRAFTSGRGTRARARNPRRRVAGASAGAASGGSLAGHDGSWPVCDRFPFATSTPLSV